MDTESKELLREWLVRSLEPVCDADPEVLSKYVLALIQNDPKKDGLRETCISKLEEFLGDETTPFVSRLFVTLETESYRKEPSSQAARQEEPRAEKDHHASASHSSHHDHSKGREEDPSRRRARGPSDDEDEQSRHSKRRRDDEIARDGRRYNGSPRRGADARRDGYGGRDGGRGGGAGMVGQRGPGPRGGEWERDPRGFPMHQGDRRHNNFPPEWAMGIPPPGMWPPHYPPPHGGFPPHPMGDFDPNVYNPENPGMMPPPHQMGMMMGPRHMGGGPGPGGPGGPGGYYPYPGRGRGGGRGNFHGGRSGGGGPPRGGGDDGELSSIMGGGPGQDAAMPFGAKTTLRVSNVDPKYVNMTKLSLHFSKFGNVVNVQMRPNHKCAYVQYASEDDAKKAFHSPYPVCNNRFIEVKWAKYDAKDPQGAPTEEVEAESKELTTVGGNTVQQADGATAETSKTATAAPPSATEAVDKSMTQEELRAAALEKGRQVLEEKRELLEKQRQLMKQKEELLKRQLAQQKELLERMSQNPAIVSAQDKRELLNKITTLSDELKALQPRREVVAPKANGSSLSGLKAELSALEAVAAAANGQYASGGGGGRGRGRGGGPAAGGGGRWAGAAAAGGRGYYRGGGGGPAGRGGGRGYSNTLDNRTTIVKVEDLPEEARDPSVLEQHFGNFGGIEQVVVDEKAPNQGFIKFHDRYAGQAALTRGNMFGDARLQLSWVEVQDAPASMAPSTPQAPNGGGAEIKQESSEVSASA